MDIFYFTYADPKGNLSNLYRERKAHHDLLVPRFLNANFTFFQNIDFTTEDLNTALKEYLDRITIFHYSGHAGTEELELQNGTSYIEGMAKQLKTLLGSKQLPELTLMFLNGCSTYGMVKGLLDAGVPIVIATSASVEDQTAANFSINFYKALVKGLTIGKSFEDALAILRTTNNSIKIYRDIGLVEEGPDEALWGIFTNPLKKTLLNYRIPEKKDVEVPGNGQVYELNDIIRGSLYQSLLQVKLPKIMNLEADRLKMIDITEEINSALLMGYPGPVSDQLGKLFKDGVKLANEDDITTLRRHLDNLYNLYQTLSELLFLMFLAQLWEICLESGGRPELPAANRSIDAELLNIKLFFSTGRNKRLKIFDFRNAILSICSIFEACGKKISVEELKILNDQFLGENELIRCFEFFDKHRDQLANQGYILLDRNGLMKQCENSEKFLAIFFDKLSFLAFYDFGVLKTIEVHLPRFHNQPTYKYGLFKLPKNGNYKYIPVSPNMSGFTSVKSVIMLKSKNFVSYGETIAVNGQINLYPFLLDNLLADPFSQIGDLIIYSHYDPETESLIYEACYGTGSNTIKALDQVENRDLFKTFEAFVAVFFNQNLETINQADGITI